MSATAPAVPSGATAHAPMAPRWGWFVALGVAMLLLGFVALADVVAASLASVIFIGAAMLVGGIFQIAHAIAMRRGWKHFALGLLCGLLYVLGGSFIMNEPVAGSVLITMFVLIAFVIGGVVRCVLALRHRELPGWWLILLGGVVSIVVGVVLYMALPWSGLWVLGMLVGIELVVQGVSWLRFGFALRAHRASA